MTVGALPPISRREKVPRAILEHFHCLITNGRLKWGERLPPEKEMAQSLGVSRASLREAVHLLGALGILDVRHGVGTFLVSSPTNLLVHPVRWALTAEAQPVRQLLEARRVLEKSVAGLAAERATQKDLASLRRSLDEMRNAATHDAYIDADVEFHISLAHAAGNAVLLQMMTSIRSLLYDVISRGTHDPTALASAIHHHEAILTAVRARDAASAEAAMDRHIAAVAHFVGEAFGQPASLAEANQP